MQQGTSARNTSKERQQGTPARNVARNVEQNILHKGTSWSWVINLFQLTQFALPVLPALHNRHCTFRRPHAPPPPLVHACACYACVLRERVTRVVMRVSPPPVSPSPRLVDYWPTLPGWGCKSDSPFRGTVCGLSSSRKCCSHLLFSSAVLTPVLCSVLIPSFPIYHATSICLRKRLDLYSPRRHLPFSDFFRHKATPAITTHAPHTYVLTPPHLPPPPHTHSTNNSKQLTLQDLPLPGHPQ